MMRQHHRPGNSYPESSTEDETQADANKSERKLFKCLECGMVHRSRQETKRHLKSRHGMDVPLKDITGVDDGPAKTDGDAEEEEEPEAAKGKKVRRSLNGSYKCSECSKEFKSLLGLKTHVDTIHLLLTPFICPKCGMKFGRKDTVRVHMKNVHKEIITCADVPVDYGMFKNGETTTTGSPGVASTSSSSSGKSSRGMSRSIGNPRNLSLIHI